MRDQSAITALYLQVPTLNSVREFYHSVLGMHTCQVNDDELAFAYTDSGCRLVFNQGDVAAFVARQNNLYWKVGITVRNLDVAVRWLHAQGVAVSKPQQFRDIGYLCHLKDPNGLTIELLQCGFEGREQTVETGHPIGVQAALAHITLRVTDINASQRFFAEQLNMRLMSVQAVSDLKFCLYFYGWSDEVLPNPVLESVENREWLWARPYTLIELQHVQSPDVVINRGTDTEAGFRGFSYMVVGCDEVFVPYKAIEAT